MTKLWGLGLTLCSQTWKMRLPLQKVSIVATVTKQFCRFHLHLLSFLYTKPAALLHTSLPGFIHSYAGTTKSGHNCQAACVLQEVDNDFRSEVIHHYTLTGLNMSVKTWSRSSFSAVMTYQLLCLRL